MMIAVLNTVVGESAVTLMIALLDAPIGVAVAAGITTGSRRSPCVTAGSKVPTAAARVVSLPPSEPAQTGEPGHAPACQPSDAQVPFGRVRGDVNVVVGAVIRASR
jgi:hypothetical protein